MSAILSPRASKSNGSSIVVPLAVGLGVGVPCLVTICILAWLYVRHRRVSREEDKRHEGIDIEGDVTFYETDAAVENEKQFQGRPVIRRDDSSSSFLYTPYIGQSAQSVDGFSRSMTSVLGPSPFQQSSDMLRGTRSFSNSSTAVSWQAPPRMPSQPWSDQGSGQRSYISSMPGSSAQSSLHSVASMHSIVSDSEHAGDTSEVGELSYSPTRRGSLPLDSHFEDPDFRRLSTVSRNRTPPLTSSNQSSRVSLDAHRATFGYEGDNNNHRDSIASEASMHTTLSSRPGRLTANPQFSDSKGSLAHSALAHEIVPGDFSYDTPEDDTDGDETDYEDEYPSSSSGRESVEPVQPPDEPETAEQKTAEQKTAVSEPVEPELAEPELEPVTAPEPVAPAVAPAAAPAAAPAVAPEAAPEALAEPAIPNFALKRELSRRKSNRMLERSLPDVPERQSLVLGQPEVRQSFVLGQTEHREMPDRQSYVEQWAENRRSYMLERSQSVSDSQTLHDNRFSFAPRDSFVRRDSFAPEPERASPPAQVSQRDSFAAEAFTPDAFGQHSGENFDFSEEQQLPTPESTPAPEVTAELPSRQAPAQVQVPTPDTSQDLALGAAWAGEAPQRPPSPAFSSAPSSIYAESSVYPESSISNRYGASQPTSPVPPGQGQFRSPPPAFVPVFSDYMDLPDVPKSRSSALRGRRASHATKSTRPVAPAPRNSIQVPLDESMFIEPKRKFGAKPRGKVAASYAHGNQGAF